MADHNFQKLRDHILGMSVAAEWELAKGEWALEHVEILFEDTDASEPETCPCGHYPITELCWLRNRENGGRTFVGNVCVRRFMDIPADTVADGMKRILKDGSKALNKEATLFAQEQGWINEWERRFCLSTCRKRALSVKQMDTRQSINRKVLRHLREHGADHRRP